MKPWLLVAGDFVATGGMDRANLALASSLAGRGELHLVAHRVDPELAARAGVHVHAVPKPVRSYLLGGPLLDRVGRRWGARIAARGGRVLVNGGNCLQRDVNWVHYVHAAWEPTVEGAWPKLPRRLKHAHFLEGERRALAAARVVVANSERTRRDVIERLGVAPERARTVYYGIDGARFRPFEPDERAQARKDLGWDARTPVVVFVGALGDRRKGFDTVFEAWTQLARRGDWDARLAVVGTGRDLVRWRARAREAGLGQVVELLGFRSDVPRILAAGDALVAPARYEAYGLGVHEALACGVPAFVSRQAGVAERYPRELEPLLLDDPDDAPALAEKLRAWRDRAGEWRARVLEHGRVFRERSWEAMAGEIVAFAEESASR